MRFIEDIIKKGFKVLVMRIVNCVQFSNKSSPFNFSTYVIRDQMRDSLTNVVDSLIFHAPHLLPTLVDMSSQSNQF